MADAYASLALVSKINMPTNITVNDRREKKKKGKANNKSRLTVFTWAAWSMALAFVLIETLNTMTSLF